MNRSLFLLVHVLWIAGCAARAPVPAEAIFIDILGDGSVWVSGGLMSGADELRQAAAERAAQPHIMRVNDAAPTASVIRALDQLETAGVVSISIVAAE